MSFADDYKKEITEGYEAGKSTHQLAKELDTYPAKISRAMKKLGIKPRSKSEAQTQALASGRHKHPTKGTKHSLETRIKISEAVSSAWDEIDEAERERRKQVAKDLWDAMPDSQKEALRKAATAAVREAAVKGSKMELFLEKHLRGEGYDVILHETKLLQNDKLEIDLFLPSLSVAIEVDGPGHFYPIYGQDKLNKQMKADADKAGLILANGMCIIRIKHLVKNLTEKNKREVAEAVTNELEKIEKKFPERKDRYIEVEVN